MKHLRAGIWIMQLFLVARVFAQNLVPNPGFEFYHHCPPYPGQIHEAVDWNAPNNKTTDYFHRCSSPAGGASVPANLLGFQEPYHGDGYAGIRTWIPIIEGNPYYREYLATQLLEPMVAGETYEISFMVSVAEESGYYSDDIGIYFSPEPFGHQAVYDYEPQVRQPDNVLLENTNDWVKIYSKYVAQGGEQYLLLGNFLDDERMTREVIDPQLPVVYYYIVEVVVRSCAGFEDIFSKVDTFLCPDESILIAGKEGANHYRWTEGGQSVERVVDQPGKYTVISELGCYSETTTYEIEEWDCSCRLRMPNPQPSSLPLQWLLTPAVTGYEITLYDTAGRRVGQFKDLDDSVLSLSSGMYFWKASLVCGKERRQQEGRVVVIWR